MACGLVLGVRLLMFILFTLSISCKEHHSGPEKNSRQSVRPKGSDNGLELQSCVSKIYRYIPRFAQKTICLPDAEIKKFWNDIPNRKSKYKLKIDKYSLEVSEFCYGIDTSQETDPALYKNRMVKVDGYLFNIDAVYKKMFLRPLYESCCFSICVSLMKLQDHDEIHIALPSSGCCCGFCQDFEVLRISLYKGEKPQLDFYDNPYFDIY